MQHVVFVGVQAGVVGVRVEVGQAELCREVLSGGSVVYIPVSEESFFPFFPLVVLRKGETGAEREAIARTEKGLQTPFFFLVFSLLYAIPRADVLRLVGLLEIQGYFMAVHVINKLSPELAAVAW